MISDAAYLLALTTLDGVGSTSALSVVRHFKTAEELEGAQKSDLDKALGEKRANVVSSQLANGWKSLLTRSQTRVEKHLALDIHPIAITQKEYPQLLKHIAEPPPVLYVKGNLQILQVLDAVAVIGTRDPTALGEQIATRVSKKFVENGFIVVSGLAKGIDATAQQAACQQGYTIAVLANPLNTVYPSENKKLADKILKNHGTLVGELALEERTFKNSFVKRDRIQSGLSLGVIPVQTDVEGGTMHTVRFAEEQKRLLFCPTPLEEEKDKKQWAGILNLIRSNRAKPFQSKDYSDIVAQLREHKTRLIQEYGLVETPLPPRPEPVKPSEAEIALARQEALFLELVSKFREAGLATDKKTFNAYVTKLRNGLFGKPAKRKTEDTQQKLLD